MNQTSDFGKINDKPLEHHVNGTIFRAERCDLRCGVTINKPLDKIPASDMFVFGAWHALQIHGDLNGFGGYDAVQFKYVPEREDAGPMLTRNNIYQWLLDEDIGPDIMEAFEQSSGWVKAYEFFKPNDAGISMQRRLQTLYAISNERHVSLIFLGWTTGCVVIVPSAATISDKETLYTHLLSAYNSTPKLRAVIDELITEHNSQD